MNSCIYHYKTEFYKNNSEQTKHAVSNDKSLKVRVLAKESIYKLWHFMKLWMTWVEGLNLESDWRSFQFGSLAAVWFG